MSVANSKNVGHSLLPQNADDFQLLDKRAAASLLNVSVRQIRYLCKLHGLPYSMVGGRVMCQRQSLIDWVKSREQNSLSSNASQERETGISSSGTFQNPQNDSEVRGGNHE